MTGKIGPLGMWTDDRYRIISEPRIVQMLILIGAAYEEPGEAEKICSAALHNWIDAGLPFKAGPNGERFFDPAELYNFMKLAGIEGRDRFMIERYITTYRRLVNDLEKPRPTDNPGDRSRRLVMEFKRRFHLQSITPGSKLRLRIPAPRMNDFVTDLQVTPLAELAPTAQFHVSTGRVEARLVTGSESEFTLGAKFSFVSRPQLPGQGQLQPPPDPIYLAESEGLIVVTKRVRALAQKLAGPNTSAPDAIKAFWEYMNTELMFGNLHYDQIDLSAPGDFILDHGWMDCHLASALLVALCRAHGIPARLLYGHNLFRKSPTNHHWIEAWIEGQGWTPYDLMDWELSPAGCDLELRDLFFGRLNYRVPVEIRPRDFTGTIGVPIPENLCIIQVPTPDGVEIQYMDEHARPIFSDTVSVTG